jgi:cysteine synthase A
MELLDRCNDADRAWVTDAIGKVEADANRSADTHLLPFPLPGDWGIDLYLKDESVHPTGSLKHRLARSLFLYGLCNGWIGPKTTIVEASSGSTAVSEAYFARMLGLPFIAVMPASTQPEKVALIEFQGGKCHLVEDPASVVVEARWLAEDTGGHFMDQFTYAERATDWRGNNNIAESIYAQMELERHPVPSDPENSAFYPAWEAADWTHETGLGSRIEGIGRPRVEPSFQPTLVDRMVRVPDAASLAAIRAASAVLGRRVGGSTGTNLWGAFGLIAEMRAAGLHGSVVTLLCDGGERYANTYYSDEWVAAQGLDMTPYLGIIDRFLATGVMPSARPAPGT